MSANFIGEISDHWQSRESYLFLRNLSCLIGVILATLIVKLIYEMEQLRGENTIQFFVCAMCKVYFIVKRTRQVSKVLLFGLKYIKIVFSLCIPYNVNAILCAILCACSLSMS